MRRNDLWISISDLLSSVVLVVLLVFLLTTPLPQETQKLEMMNKINAALQEYQERGQIKVHLETGTFEFTSVNFNSGSAQLPGTSLAAIKDFSEQLKIYMSENPKMELLIEGHTALEPVSPVITKDDYFGNNIQLSTLRAANFRSALLDNIGQEYAQRVSIAGYGETRLKNTEKPSSEENRRIEVRIILDGQYKN